MCLVVEHCGYSSEKRRSSYMVLIFTSLNNDKPVLYTSLIAPTIAGYHGKFSTASSTV